MQLSVRIFLRLLFCYIVFISSCVVAKDWVDSKKTHGDFPLVTQDHVATVVYSVEDFRLAGIAAQDLANDIERVTGKKPAVKRTLENLDNPVVIIGTLGKSPLIQQLIDAGKLEVNELQGQWESFLIQVIKNPFPSVDTALVILGSDRRGTAYGVYELSQAIGVSPWYWWADVTPQKKSSLYVDNKIRRFGPPSVKYRGIFINDEGWGIHQWAAKTFEPENGGIGPKTYQKIFELLLRLQANTLWPAMHPVSKPFNVNPQNAQLADDYGIVMGSSHAEPMLRNNVGEWKLPHDQYNYLSHRQQVHQYWEERIKTNSQYENIYTLGMRGIHDSFMQGPTNDAERIQLLHTIFSDQRELLARYNQSASEKIPQMFCAYKEVLGLYRQGLIVPDDVTIVWPDDNFGYLRNFANAGERNRKGGFGVYYHVSYLGAPMAYLWLNTTPPALIWEEMKKSYEMGADRIWIVNVGDLKPAEIATELFMQMAWNINRWDVHNQKQYLQEWATREFGSTHAKEIATLMQDYYQLNYQRKPEHLQWWLPRQSPVRSNLSQVDVTKRLNAFRQLHTRSEYISKKISSSRQAAFFQLVSYPVQAAALANIRFLEGEQGNSKAAYAANKQLHVHTEYWNSTLSAGKWKHFMAVEPADAQWDKYRISPWKMPSVNLRQQSSVLTDLTKKTIRIEVENFTDQEAGSTTHWAIIDGLGHSGVGSVTVLPFNSPSLKLNIQDETQLKRAPRLSYSLNRIGAGDYQVCMTLLPTHPLSGSTLDFALGLNANPPLKMSLIINDGSAEWAQGVLSNKRELCTPIKIDGRGENKLHIYGLSAGVILDSIEITPSQEKTLVEAGL